MTGSPEDIFLRGYFTDKDYQCLSWGPTRMSNLIETRKHERRVDQRGTLENILELICWWDWEYLGKISFLLTSNVDHYHKITCSLLLPSGKQTHINFHNAIKFSFEKKRLHFIHKIPLYLLRFVLLHDTQWKPYLQRSLTLIFCDCIIFCGP